MIYDQKLKIFYSNKINDDQYFSGFGTRNLNISQIKKNLHSIVIPDQTHSTNIVDIDRLKENKIIRVKNTDGIVTFKKNIGLTVVTGDCVPIIFVDKKIGLIGISHQGWRGTLGKMAVKMAETMVVKGSQKKNIIAAIGPSIGECCYNIEENRAKLFEKEFKNYLHHDRNIGNNFIQWRNGKIYLNLMRLNYLQMVDFGIPQENIDFFPFCTSCDKKRFFSYRRDRKENYGEMLSFIGVK